MAQRVLTLSFKILCYKKPVTVYMDKETTLCSKTLPQNETQSFFSKARVKLTIFILIG